MTLDTNLIRKILLFIEEHAILTDDLQFKRLRLRDFLKSDDFKKFDKAQIAYTLICLNEAHFIVSHNTCSDEAILEICVSRLTYSGHEFLETIKPDTIWNETKTILGKIGCKSLDVIVQVASNVLTDLIKAQMGIC